MEWYNKYGTNCYIGCGSYMLIYRRQSSTLGVGDREFESLYPNTRENHFSLNKSPVNAMGLFVYIYSDMFIYTPITNTLPISNFNG